MIKSEKIHKRLYLAVTVDFETRAHTIKMRIIDISQTSTRRKVIKIVFQREGGEVIFLIVKWRKAVIVHGLVLTNKERTD